MVCGSLIIPGYLEIKSNAIFTYAKQWDITYSLKYFLYHKERISEQSLIKHSIQARKSTIE